MENNQTLKPDTSIPPNIHSEQIKEEFYKWFESRGLLAELRAYMRQLMVKAIEENNKNGKNNLIKKSSTSPKLQAINLLVVDYLFHEDYFYTVSVFASEAHILDSLPQYSRYVTESVKQRRWDPGSLPRFSRQETEDILDTLHIPPTSLQMRQAADCYLASRESLLACIVRTMIPVRPQSSGNGSMEEEEEDVHSHCSASEDKERSCCYQLWSQEMQQLLLMAGLKLVHIHRMQHKWAQTIENERQQARREVEEEFEAREAEWQRVVEERLQEERAGLLERQSRVEVREQGLANLAEQLTVVHEDVTQRLSQLQFQTDQLDERALQQEKEQLHLQVKMEDLKTREENLERALSSNQGANRKSFQPMNKGPVTNRVYHQNPATKEACVQVVAEEEFGITNSCQTLNPVTTASTQTLDVPVVASTQTVAVEDHELQTSLDQTDPELISQLEQARRKISELQEENLELRAHILQQRQRIDELTNRAANLSSQLEDSQVAVAVLSGRDSAVVASVPTPPPHPPVFIAPTFGFRTPQRQGGGEESLFVPRAQQVSPRADTRRRPLRFSFSQQPSPSSGESSPTDEVIQNARTRIQHLEQESLSIQRNFQDFQTRLFTTDSLMFPPLRASRTSDPIMRVRRSEIGSTFPSTRLSHPPPSFDNSNRLIQNRPQYEEHESSSEFYETMRIESLSSSRRLFNQRNIRHFERWKQFKKKFQKRDGSDYNRRNKALNSNTSSEDDDAAENRNLRRRQDINQSRRNPNTQLVNQDQQTSEIQNENEKLENLSATNDNKNNKGNVKVTKVKASQVEVPTTTGAQIDNLPVEKVIYSKKESAPTCPSKTGTSTELNLERSAKLIESVKVLLDAQNIKESGTSTLSNGSLGVESLPRDSVDNSQVDIGRTDSSIVTVQKVKPSKESETGNMTQYRCDIVNPEPVSVNKPESQTNKVFQEAQTVHQTPQSENKRDAYLDESNSEKPKTAMPESTLESEDLTSNFAATSSDVAEVESGDRATTSLTSGSDILRELNPSTTDSSSSVLSAGFGEDSKQSSDFWD